jgi:hypothetical protein
VPCIKEFSVPSAKYSTFRDFERRTAANAIFSVRLSTLVYRSRALVPWTADDLQRMLDIARARNRAESITGMLICEDDRFFQWIEGPTDRLAQVWESIRRDPRHTDIEVLGESSTPMRFFGQWDMKLITRDTRAAAGSAGAKRTPVEFIDRVYGNPEGIRALLATLAPTGDNAKNDANDATRGDGLHAAPLRSDVHLPSIACADNAVAYADHAGAKDLAKLLIAADPAAAFVRVEQLFSASGSIAHFCATLVEPCARVLGDWWGDDQCGEFEVTLGLCRLQAAVCRVSSELDSPATPSKKLTVLVAPQPGEIHSLNAALDAELLWQAGWDTRCEHPATDDALCALLKSTPFDALDLSLSAAFGREHWLPRMTHTIALAREASLNPALVVVVGGRAVFEESERYALVGADAGCATSMRIEAVLTAAHRATN